MIRRFLVLGALCFSAFSCIHAKETLSNEKKKELIHEAALAAKKASLFEVPYGDGSCDKIWGRSVQELPPGDQRV